MLNHKNYFIKERVGFMKLVDTYDILDPETQQVIGTAKEEPGWTQYLRMLVNKQMLPTTLNVYENGGTVPVFTIHRPMAFFRSKVRVTGAGGVPLGYFKSKLFSFGGGFWVFDNADQKVAEVKGDWKGWNFKLLSTGGAELGTVTKKWAGFGKELFTSADNYMISLSAHAEGSSAASLLLLAAGLAIDVVFKEKG
ncbi:MAG: oxidoreductase [Pedosphaera sp.]|nr:oxidoreductase [Pedosphaera sp.]